MTRLLRFFQNVVKSFTSAQFYQTLLKAPFSFSLKYFLLLTLLLSLVNVILGGIVFASFAKFITARGPDFIAKAYPSGLTLEVKNGQLTTSLKQPLIIPSSAIFKDKQTLKNNFLVIDANTAYSPGKFLSYNTLIWLTKNALVVDSSSEVRTLPLDGFDGLSVSKETVVNFTIQAASFLDKFLPYLILGGSLFIVLSSILGHLLTVAILAVLSWILLKLAHYKFSYSRSLQLTMHAVTLPLILSTFPLAILFQLPIPFWQAILALIILFYFLNKSEMSFPRKR